MKRLIMYTLFCLVLISSLNYGQINYRMTMQSNVQIPAGTNTLVIRLECNSPVKNYDILYHSFTFDIGSGLNSVFVGNPSYSHGLLSSYTITTSRVGRMITCDYTNGSGGTFTGTTTWQTIADITFTYPYSGGVTTTFAWGDVIFTENHALLGAWPVTVIPAPIPLDLQDLSLPVEMSNFYTEYSYENGVELTWVTQSELNLEGFHVLRSDSPEGEFTRITNALIPGQGNSSSYQEYSFNDPNVEWNSDYYYKLYEVSSIHQDTSKTYFGPILSKTDKAPTTFKLSNNYPNPFNPSTEINFEIVEGGMIDLSVYNLLGQKIATLINEEKPAGIYTVPWFGLNESGQAMPSGVYLYRLVGPEGSEVRKMMKVE